MQKVIATDLDGTLFYPRRKARMISSHNRKFLRKFIDDGNRVAIVSGRNYFYSQKVVKKIDRPVDILGCNGAFIKANGIMIRECFFDKKMLSIIMDDINNRYHPGGIFLMSKTSNFLFSHEYSTKFVRFVYRLWHFVQGVYGEPFEVNDEQFSKELEQGLIYKIMVLIGITPKKKRLAKDINKELRDKYGDYIECSWIGEFIEITPRGCSKAEGIKYYIDYLGIKHDNVMVVGDSGNDISMFNEFPDNSFCMEHSPITVSKYASHSIRRLSDMEKFIYPKGEGKNE
jgi:Cof subfamily protein (haloacid dehalogenase superfamily)